VFEPAAFLAKVKKLHETLGGVYIVTGEGLVDDRGQYVMAKAGTVATDAFGHPELGAVGDYLKELIESNLQLKTRVIVPDISQQSAIHCAAAVDAQCAERVGRKAVTAAVAGKSGYMTALVINKAGSVVDSLVELAVVANAERKVPAEFISPSGDFVTTEFISYLRPFIQGNISLNYEASLPLFTRLIQTKGKKEGRLR
jgi:6-phosphofructokinase 1